MVGYKSTHIFSVRESVKDYFSLFFSLKPVLGHADHQSNCRQVAESNKLCKQQLKQWKLCAAQPLQTLLATKQEKIYECIWKMHFCSQSESTVSYTELFEAHKCSGCNKAYWLHSKSKGFILTGKATVKGCALRSCWMMTFQKHFSPVATKAGGTLKWTEIVCLSALEFKFGKAESKLFFSIKLNNRWCSAFHRLRLADKEGECSVETIPRRSYSRTLAETHTLLTLVHVLLFKAQQCYESVWRPRHWLWCSYEKRKHSRLAVKIQIIGWLTLQIQACCFLSDLDWAKCELLYVIFEENDCK